MSKRLFIFDMDGTLLPKTAATIEISKVTNTYGDLLSLEEKYNKGIITTKEFASSIHKLWGCLDETIIKTAFQNSDKLMNIEKVVQKIAKIGGKSCIITMSPDYFADLFYDLGFNYIFASNFPKSSLEELDITKILTPENKSKIALELCQNIGFQFEESVAFGDSMSDYDLFKYLEDTISINGNEKISQLAKYNYRGNDLMEAFSLLEI